MSNITHNRCNLLILFPMLRWHFRGKWKMLRVHPGLVNFSHVKLTSHISQTNHLCGLLSSVDVNFHFTSTFIWIFHNVCVCWETGQSVNIKTDNFERALHSNVCVRCCGATARATTVVSRPYGLRCRWTEAYHHMRVLGLYICSVINCRISFVFLNQEFSGTTPEAKQARWCI